MGVGSFCLLASIDLLLPFQFLDKPRRKSAAAAAD
jgi:hypothetical protein